MASFFQSFRRNRPVPKVPKSPPRGIGRYALFVGGAVLAFGAAWVWRGRRESARYRREALGELQRLAEGVRSPETRPDALAELPRLVRRVCLELAAPERIDALSGHEWLEFLDSTWPGGTFLDGPGRVLATLRYSNRAGLQAVTEDQALELVELVRRWIIGHRKPLQRIASRESRS
ncbi:MAG: DUF4381 domain-containing protein [Acidobacteria bacterium]|nr:DUF4381 domain-containing protein [Acidobacteriota bacterium]